MTQRRLRDPLHTYMWVAAGEDREHHSNFWDRITPEMLEKFADMIIKDCCHIAELKEQGLQGYKEEYSVGWYIRGAFGVKPDEPKFKPKKIKPWTSWPRGKDNN